MMKAAENASVFDFGAMLQRENAAKPQRYRILNQVAQKSQIVFTGSSLMEQFPLNELMMSFGIRKIAYNRGFSGYTTMQFKDVLDDCVLDLDPSKLFINIGSNDLDMEDQPIENLKIHYSEILQHIRERVPECEINMLAYYPVPKKQTGPLPAGKCRRTKEMVDRGNEIAAELARQFGCRFINVNYVLADGSGYLKPEFAFDDIHMWPSAYCLILKELEPFL